MNISNNGNDGARPVVVSFQSYVSKKPDDKQTCKGCLYLFTQKNKSHCYCDQCSSGRRLYGRLQLTKAMLKAGGENGYH